MFRLKNKAFTLIEVMLAATILSVGLTLVVRSYLTSLCALKTSQNFLTANLLLEEKIWEKKEEQMRLGKIEPEEDADKFAAPFEVFDYKISFEEEDLEAEKSNPFKLYQGVFEVSWQERKRKHSASCATFLRSKQ